MPGANLICRLGIVKKTNNEKKPRKTTRKHTKKQNSSNKQNLAKNH